MKFQVIAIASASAILAACAAPTSAEDEQTLEEALADPRVGEKTDRICFTRGINGFSEWDGPQDGMILHKGASQKYLVLLGGGCLTADRAQAIGVDERFGGGCLTRGDYLFVSDSIFPGRSSDPFSVDRCLVTAIYDWDEDKGADE